MNSFTVSGTREHSSFGHYSGTATPCVAEATINRLPWMMKPRARAPRKVGAKFAHLESNFSVMIEWMDSYSYTDGANELQLDFLGTIDEIGVASRKRVCTVENNITKSVIDTFKQADKVASIYGHDENEKFSFLVFINVSKYDASLAVQLATYAVELEDRFTSATFEYHYIPIALGYDSILNKEDKCYYKRTEHE